MDDALHIRPIAPADLAAWRPLWAGYNAFYGREGPTALAESVTATTWTRFFDPQEPVFALIAQDRAGRVLGLAHYLFHRSTIRIEPTCYLQDLFTEPAARGRGVGSALIRGVYQRAQEASARRVYWQTHESNRTGRALYDKLARHAGFLVYAQDLG